MLGLALAADSAVPPSVTAALIDAADERSAMADALHDGPVQDLVAARFAVDLAVRSGDLELARDAVQSALVGLRRLMWQLRPRGADGLGDALERLAAVLVESGHPGLHLQVAADADVLAPAAAVSAYRLVQAVVAGAVTAPVVRLVRAPAPGGRQLLALDVEGAGPLPHPERWRRTAVALGGDLVAGPARVRLLLPPPADLPTGPVAEPGASPRVPAVPAQAPPAGGPAPTLKALL